MAQVADDINNAFYPIGRFLRYMEDPAYGPQFFITEIDKWQTANSDNAALPGWAKFALKTASWGHNYFPDPKNGNTRHVIGSFLTAEQYGALKAWDITSANEYYGFIMHDLWSKLTGQERTNWAMEDKDFLYNYIGSTILGCFQ
jgi:hypothetical protein